MFGDGGWVKTRPRRRIAVVLFLVLAAVAATAAYATFSEPQRIEITRHSFVGNVKRTLRIAHLTDLHTSGVGKRERNLILLVRRENPDIIVITGDTTNGAGLGPARDLLINLSAPNGVWLVRGDSERWPLGENERSLLARRWRESPAEPRARPFATTCGWRDSMILASGTPDLDQALQGAPAPAFKLVLMHAPDYFPRIAGRFDLALAGHSHGGQIVVPGYGPLLLPPGGSRYVQGWFTQNRSHLYVNRGLGTSRLPLRLFARPELAIIDVRPR